jgi:quercetin dioxygenase-like cupin family protein
VRADRVPLARESHTVYELGAGTLLVFKPFAHCEGVHAHPYRQRLRVLKGRLRVEIGRTRLLLDADSDPLELDAGQPHATEALEDTWLVAERTR